MARLTVILFALFFASTIRAERINHEGRILGPEPVVAAPTLFNTPEADAIVSAMQIMPVDNPWNEDISKRPLLPNSDAMIAQIRSDLSASRQTLRPFYEMNYVLVPSDQPRVTIPFFNYPDESDLDGGAFPNGRYPIPANLPVEGWPRETGGLTLEQWQRDVNDTGGDRHSIMVNPGTGSIWETWLTRLTNSGWEASNGAKFNLHSNALRPAGWTSADAAGLPMFPALVRYDECERGMVEHAMRIIVARTRREYIYPATHYASSIPASSVNTPAMGQRVRLKAGFAVPENWTKQEKAVLRGLKKYGAIVADNGGFFSISVCPDNRFPDGAFDNLSRIGIENFEIVQTTGPNQGPRSQGAPTVDAGPDRFTESSVTLNGTVNAPSGATVEWKLYSGPSAVVFGNPAQPVTSATFEMPGVYTLMLSAADGVHAVAYDAVVVNVSRRVALANISTRVDVRTGQNVAIAGFIIAGDVSKNVIIRAIGPSLATDGFAGALSDPALDLYDSAGNLLLTNNDWKDTQEQAIRDTTIPPAHDREAAIVTSLAPGAYTAVVRGQDGSSGVALVEAYDLQPSPSAKLANISTRGVVGSGDKVMIGGVIVRGSEQARVLFRAIGPTLAAAGIEEPLQDPGMELFDGNGTRLTANNDWKDSQRGAIESTGLPPADDRESAIVANLNPGGYTVVVRAASGATGTALVEAYSLP